MDYRVWLRHVVFFGFWWCRGLGFGVAKGLLGGSWVLISPPICLLRGLRGFISTVILGVITGFLNKAAKSLIFCYPPKCSQDKCP